MYQHITSIRFTFFILIFVSSGFRLSAQYLLSIDSLSSVLSSAREDSVKVKVLFEIGRERWFQRNFPGATSHLHRSVSLAEKSNYLTYQSDAYNLLANVYIKQEAFDTAFIYLQKALDLKDEKFTPLIYDTYSKLYYQLGDYQSSLDYALQSVEGLERNQSLIFNMQAIYGYLMVGDILNKLGREESAFDYYQKAYKKARTSPKNWYIKTPIQKIAAYYFSKKEFSKARHLYDTIIEIDKDAPSFEPTMFSYEGLGNIEMEQKAFKKAIEYYKMSLGYAFQKGLSANAETFCAQLGTAFLEDRQKDSARYYLQEAIRRSSKSKNYLNLSAAYKSLATLYHRSENYPEAFAAFQLYTLYNDSILSIEKIRSVNNLEVLYRTRQHENEILRLQKAQQEKDFAIRKRNISIAVGIGLVLGMGVIIFLLQRTNRHKQHLQEEKLKQMERQHQIASLQSMVNGQEAERSRVARDLHDGLGGLFSTIKMYFSTLEHEHSTLKTNDLFKKSYSLVDSASVEIRRIAHNMMPEVLMKMGLINAVKDLAGHISAGRLLTVSIEAHGMSKRLNTATEIMLYRIIQELLNNIIKHAKATEAIIQFIKDGNRLSIVVEDNGCGFNTMDADEKIHSGIETIKSRVNYLNGEFTIDSQKDIGTTVMMDFLINDN